MNKSTNILPYHSPTHPFNFQKDQMASQPQPTPQQTSNANKQAPSSSATDKKNQDEKNNASPDTKSKKAGMTFDFDKPAMTFDFDDNGGQNPPPPPPPPPPAPTKPGNANNDPKGQKGGNKDDPNKKKGELITVEVRGKVLRKNWGFFVVEGVFDDFFIVFYPINYCIYRIFTFQKTKVMQQISVHSR